MGCHQSATKCTRVQNSAMQYRIVQRKYEMSETGCMTLFYNGILVFGLGDGCMLPCCPFGFVFRQLDRLCLLWVSRQVTNNSV